MTQTQIDRLYRRAWERMTRYDGYQPLGLRLDYHSYYLPRLVSHTEADSGDAAG